MEEQNNVAHEQESFKGKGALDAFLNLLLLVTLGWTAFSFGGVIFQIINRYFGNYALGYDNSYYSSTMKFNIASLLIVTPVFLALTGILHKQYKERKLNSASGIHRWLTYLMLFIAFCNIVGSLIALVFKFLDGIFFSSFILKALTILVIALGIFGYNWYDLKRKDYEAKSQVSLISSILVIVLSAGAIIGGFVISGSPQKARKLNFDRQRINDLSSLRGQISEYERVNKKLPQDLSDSQFSRFNDPETKNQYEYSFIGEKQYQLCANFSLPAEALTKDTYNGDYYGGYETWYYHKEGRQCYKLVLDENNNYGKPIPAPVQLQ